MDLSSWNLNSASRRGVLVAAAAAVTAVLIRSKPVAVTPRTPDGNRSFPDPGFLISAADLQGVLDSDSTGINLLDASSLASFRSRHIAGAQGIWWQDTMQLNSIYYGAVLKPDEDKSQGRRQRLLERWGIRAGSPTVVYDDTDSQAACRVAWFLRFVGVDALVLDGGLAAWMMAGGATVSDVHPASTDDIATVAPQDDFYFLAEPVATRVADGSWRVVDLREASERSSGRYAQFSIPGAAEMPRSLFQAPGGGIRDPESLAALLANAAINPGDQLILMGPTGMDARLPWVALRAMGAPTVAIADGGWQEWVTIPGVPLESLA